MQHRSSFFLLASSLLAVAFACSDDDPTGVGASGTGASGSGAAGPGSGANGSGASGSGAGASGSTGTAGSGGVGGSGACAPSLATIDEPPDSLSETGLYDGAGEINAFVRSFTPQFALWSDDADKLRYAYIPECTQINTDEMDLWQVPVGTRLWKEFSRNGVKLETRFITRKGPGQFDFEFATYHWNSPDDAVRVFNGVIDANGTTHDIPAATTCSQCHRKDWRVLGFSAVQLSHSLPGETIASLSAEGLLTTPLPGGIPVPGADMGTQNGLGYLHANCANCHNEEGVGNIVMDLKLREGNTAIEDTGTFLTAIDQPTTMYMCNMMPCQRIESGDAANSAIIQRLTDPNMNPTPPNVTMPPIAVETMDTDGVAALTLWINALP